jgi:hypothetical protein
MDVETHARDETNASRDDDDDDDDDDDAPRDEARRRQREENLRQREGERTQCPTDQECDRPTTSNATTSAASR